MYLPGEVKLPTNAITRIVEEALGRASFRSNINLWEVKSERFELLMTALVQTRRLTDNQPHASVPLNPLLWPPLQRFHHCSLRPMVPSDTENNDRRSKW